MAEDKITREEARKMTFEINAEGVRKGLETVLADPKAAKFLRELLKLATEMAAKRDPKTKLVEEGDLLRIFDTIMKQGRLKRSIRNGAVGFVGRGNASIEIGVILTLPESATKRELEEMYLKTDIPFILHETLHHAGTLTFFDEDYARAVCQMLGKDFDKELPRIEGEDEKAWIRRCSRLWDKELRRRCKL